MCLNQIVGGCAMPFSNYFGGNHAGLAHDRFVKPACHFVSLKPGWRMSCALFLGTWTLGLLFTAGSAVAGDGILCELIGKDYCRRNSWPYPHICQDIASARAPMAMQVVNGWERQNLLADHYFDPITQQLNEAGRRKVQWILLDAPEERRIVFVHRTISVDETNQRVAAVRNYMAELGPGAPTASVAVSTIPADGTSAARVDWVNRKFITVLPEPKLPEVKQPGDTGK